MSNLFPAIMLFLVIISISLVFYLKGSNPEIEVLLQNANKTSELKRVIEQNKLNKEEWEKQNPKLVQQLNKKEPELNITAENTILEIEKICGVPDDSRYDDFFYGKIDVYRYRRGICSGRMVEYRRDLFYLTDAP